MNRQNLSVINLRKTYRVKDAAANINGYRNDIFLPGIGRYKGMWKNNVREVIHQIVQIYRPLLFQSKFDAKAITPAIIHPSKLLLYEIGLGTLTTNNGLIYEGNWMNDRKHGYGLLKKRLHSQRVQYASIYDGEWNSDKRNGEGTAYYGHGCYEGQWKHDCRDGIGIMSFDDGGGYYIGEWENDRYHGIGALYDVDAGTIYRGYFRNGKMCGEGILNFLRKGKLQKGIWVNGVCSTSILQDDIEKERTIPMGGRIPEIGVADPVGILKESLKNGNKSNKPQPVMAMKKQNVNFDGP